ncbi:MAG: SurA N-terminal domain-containing protein [Sphaerochaetaceae bacterium]
MPSNDSKTPTEKDKSVVKFEKGKEKPKKREEMTFSRVITYVILVLVAIALIAGVAIPAIGPRGGGDSLKFGSWDGTPITFANGNYFHRQYQRYAQQSKGSSQAVAYQVWMNAYQGTVFHIAIDKMAHKAGLKVTDKAINEAIIDSGLYQKDGKFDRESYEQASNESKNLVHQQISESLPAQMIFNDIASLLTSPQELAFITAIGDKARSFEYVVFDASLYPDDLTQQYAMANSVLFTLIDLSSISVESEERANELRLQVANGELSFDEAARNNSTDAYHDEGGRRGNYYFHEIQNEFIDKDAVNLLFATKQGALSEVFATVDGYTFFKVEQNPHLADLSDPEVLKDIKLFIGNDSQAVSTYLQTAASEFSEAVKGGEDFKRKAQSEALKLYEVESTVPNTGNSSFFIGFSNTDSGGYLRAISLDNDTIKALYGAPLNTLVEPFASGGAYVVARPIEEGNLSQDMVDYVKFLYPYILQETLQQDLIQSIFTSDKFEDNFMATFIAHIMDLSATN